MIARFDQILADKASKHGLYSLECHVRETCVQKRLFREEFDEFLVEFQKL
jgi:hypothetical protein